MAIAHLAEVSMENDPILEMETALSDANTMAMMLANIEVEHFPSDDAAGIVLYASRQIQAHIKEAQGHFEDALAYRRNKRA